MPLLESMAASGRLAWYVNRLTLACRTEENDETIWDLYLHKEFSGKSFAEFKGGIEERARSQAKAIYLEAHPKETAKVVSNSMSILQSFGNPNP